MVRVGSLCLNHPELVQKHPTHLAISEPTPVNPRRPTYPVLTLPTLSYTKILLPSYTVLPYPTPFPGPTRSSCHPTLSYTILHHPTCQATIPASLPCPPIIKLKLHSLNKKSTELSALRSARSNRPAVRTSCLTNAVLMLLMLTFGTFGRP